MYIQIVSPKFRSKIYKNKCMSKMYVQIDVKMYVQNLRSYFPLMSGCTLLHCTCVRLYFNILYRCQAVLYCTILYCTVQGPGCTILYCTVYSVQCTVYRGQLYFGLSHSFLCLAASNKVIATALHCTTLHYTTVHYTALLHSGLHCTTLS